MHDTDPDTEIRHFFPQTQEETSKKLLNYSSEGEKKRRKTIKRKKDYENSNIVKKKMRL